MSKPTGLKFIFRTLRYKNYRLFFGGQSISLIGTWMQGIALPWLVYRLTGSAFLLGLVGFAGQIPTFLLSPFAGVLIDRWSRHRILLVTQILSLIQSLVLAILFFNGSIEIWHIILLSISLGCVNAFDMPARQSFVVEMVEKKEDLGNAIALNSLMVNAARLLGPCIAGILIASSGEGICFLINSLSYLFAIVSLLMIKGMKEQVKLERLQVFSELREGFVYTFGFPPIRALILLLGLVSLMGLSCMVLMPVFVKEILHGDSHAFGFLMAASGTGALLGGLYMASRKSVLGLVKIVPLSVIIFGIAIIAFSMSRIFWLSCVLMLIEGFGMMLQITSGNTILQTIVDDNKRGRVMSFYIMAFMGTAPFGSLLAGGLASSLGVPTTLIIGGISCVLGGCVFASQYVKLKEMIHPIYVRLGIIPEVASGLQTATALTVPPEE